MADGREPPRPRRQSATNARAGWQSEKQKRMLTFIPFPNPMPERLSYQNYDSTPPDLKSVLVPSTSPDNYIYSHGRFVKDEDIVLMNQGLFVSCSFISTKFIMEQCCRLFETIDPSLIAERKYALSAQCLIDNIPALYDDNHLLLWKNLEDCYECSLFDALYMVLRVGIALQSECPFVGKYQGYKKFLKAGSISSLFEIPLDTASDVTISSYIQENGFLVGTFTCYEDIESYKSGIYMGGDEMIIDAPSLVGGGRRAKKAKKDDSEQPGKGRAYGHCVLVIGNGCFKSFTAEGVEQTTSFLQIANSRGLNWGMNGKGNIKRSLFVSLIGIVGAGIKNPA